MFRVLQILAALMIAMSATSCFSSAKDKIFGVDVSSGKVITETDSHGWLGDGETFLVIKFSDETVQEEISNLFDWRPLPANDNITALIWGFETVSEDGSQVRSYGPYTSADIPNIENGWFCFSDRSPNGAKSAAPESLVGGVLNFTFAAYDADTDTLYYVKVDT